MSFSACARPAAASCLAPPARALSPRARLSSLLALRSRSPSLSFRRLLPRSCSAHQPLSSHLSTSVSPSFLSRASAAGFSSALSTMQNLARGDGYGGDGLHLFPSAPSSAPLSTVIFLHGLGDTAAGWTDVIPLLASLSCFPALRVILPTAPVRPVTLNGGFPAPAWADIFSLDKDAAEDGPGFSASKARIDRIIQKEVEEAKVPPHRILLAGFSQGGALAYLVGLNSPYRLGGLVALSTWLPLASNLRVSPACLGKSQENPEKSEMAPGGVPAGPMPVLHCHGRQDELVRFEFGHESAELIRQQYAAACGDEKAKAAVQFQPFDGLGHSANAAELAQVRAFVEDILKHPV